VFSKIKELQASKTHSVHLETRLSETTKASETTTLVASRFHQINRHTEFYKTRASQVSKTHMEHLAARVLVARHMEASDLESRVLATTRATTSLALATTALATKDSVTLDSVTVDSATKALGASKDSDLPTRALVDSKALVVSPSVALRWEASEETEVSEAAHPSCEVDQAQAHSLLRVDLVASSLVADLPMVALVEAWALPSVALADPKVASVALADLKVASVALVDLKVALVALADLKVASEEATQETEALEVLKEASDSQVVSKDHHLAPHRSLIQSSAVVSEDIEKSKQATPYFVNDKLYLSKFYFQTSL